MAGDAGVLPPVHQVVHVGPVARCVTPGEHAPAVTQLHCPPQLPADQPGFSADVEGDAVGAEHHPGDPPVAGQPPGPGSGDGGTEPHRGRPAALTRGEVVEVDAHRHMRLHAAQHRHRTAGQHGVRDLHECITLPLCAGALVGGGAVGLHMRLHRRLEPLPTDCVQVPAEADRPVGVPGDRQRPTLGRVGLWAVGIQPLAVVPDRHHQVLVPGLHGHAGEDRIDLPHSHALGRGGDPPSRGDHLSDHGHLPRRHPPCPRRLSQHRQVLQRPPVAHQPRRLATRQPAVPPQPRRHALQPVAFRRLRQLRRPHRTSQPRIETVALCHQRSHVVEDVATIRFARTHVRMIPSAVQ